MAWTPPPEQWQHPADSPVTSPPRKWLPRPTEVGTPAKATPRKWQHLPKELSVTKPRLVEAAEAEPVTVPPIGARTCRTKCSQASMPAVIEAREDDQSTVERLQKELEDARVAAAQAGSKAPAERLKAARESHTKMMEGLSQHGLKSRRWVQQQKQERKRFEDARIAAAKPTPADSTQLPKVCELQKRLDALPESMAPYNDMVLQDAIQDQPETPTNAVEVSDLKKRLDALLECKMTKARGAQDVKEWRKRRAASDEASDRQKVVKRRQANADQPEEFIEHSTDPGGLQTEPGTLREDPLDPLGLFHEPDTLHTHSEKEPRLKSFKCWLCKRPFCSQSALDLHCNHEHSTVSL
mmetsp:Transcript_44521/g.81322  ORF Transcript_44521/g.81322 Transcript_44521/m.81322 type:complete len:353 (+) Transcript_44521:27-1085(+)